MDRPKPSAHSLDMRVLRLNGGLAPGVVKMNHGVPASFTTVVYMAKNQVNQNASLKATWKLKKVISAQISKRQRTLLLVQVRPLYLGQIKVRTPRDKWTIPELVCDWTHTSSKGSHCGCFGLDPSMIAAFRSSQNELYQGGKWTRIWFNQTK